MLVTPRYAEAALSDLVPSALAGIGSARGVRRDLVGLPACTAGTSSCSSTGSAGTCCQTYADDAPFLASLQRAGGRALTSGVPSTTSTSLVCLGTGLVPGIHGVVGYTMAVPGTDQLLNTLRWDTSVEPSVWQPYPTAFERAERAGVAVTTVSRRRSRGPVSPWRACGAGRTRPPTAPANASI